MAPVVSICLPTYNSEEYLGQAIDSILGQDFTDYEFVIVDNNSTDATGEIVRSYADSRIRYYKNSENVGAVRNHNVCLSYAQGRYVKFFCSDDVMLPGLITRQVRLLDQHRSVGLITSNMFVTDQALDNRRLYNFYPGFEKGPEVARVCLDYMSNFIGGPSNVMFRRDVAAGLQFDPEYRWLSDLKFFIQLLLRSDYANVDQPGCLYRRHSQTDSVLSCPPEVQVLAQYNLVTDFAAFTPRNCVRLLRQPLDRKRKTRLVLWLAKNIWNLKALQKAQATAPPLSCGFLVQQ